ncbi:hypothetical protein CALVIDRAFT_597668 [Calocera viscosa TUFC12733]|uniref:Ubiquitin-like domain-containing protein n=1 Tax=Calocera viscosa (strain TUFC12733) TaxID=1330018 RepID=A0A167N5J2_CALVF|nr:hypothetical protein CALVIDRAFT_597668 [Calocera viscosa TUFC12733]
MARSAQRRRPDSDDKNDEVANSEEDRSQETASRDSAQRSAASQRVPSPQAAPPPAASQGTQKVQIIVKFDDEQQMRVNISRSVPFSKVFYAVETRFRKQSGTVRYHYDGERVNPEDTPTSLELEDGAVIEASLFQIGGA